MGGQREKNVVLEELSVKRLAVSKIEISVGENAEAE